MTDAIHSPRPASAPWPARQPEAVAPGTTEAKPLTGLSSSQMPAAVRCAEAFEQLRLRQETAGVPRDAAGFEQAAGMRRQMLLQLQRFHEFEYGGPPVRSTVNADTGPTGNFFDDLMGLIELIKSDYLGVYEHVIGAYSAMFKMFNEKVTAILADCIKGVDDGKNVEIDSARLRSALSAVLNQFGLQPGGVLYPVDSTNPSGTYEESLKWAAALGLPPSSVQPSPPYRVMMDMSPLWTIYDSLPQSNPVKWDSARFQAWQTGFNSQESEMKNQLQVLTSKYSNANAYHDNFNKVLSSQLSQYAEMLKAYLT